MKYFHIFKPRAPFHPVKSSPGELYHYPSLLRGGERNLEDSDLLHNEVVSGPPGTQSRTSGHISFSFCVPALTIRKGEVGSTFSSFNWNDAGR